MAFENQRGKVLACMTSGGAAKYGQAPVMITRALLHRVLVDQAEALGSDVKYGKRLIQVEDAAGGPVLARFEGGSTAEGDFVGADGIRSQVRQAVMPEAPKPVYTGMMGLGGFSPCAGDSSYGAASKQRATSSLGKTDFLAM